MEIHVNELAGHDDIYRIDMVTHHVFNHETYRKDYLCQVNGSKDDAARVGKKVLTMLSRHKALIDDKDYIHAVELDSDYTTIRFADICNTIKAEIVLPVINAGKKPTEIELVTEVPIIFEEVKLNGTLDVSFRYDDDSGVKYKGLDRNQLYVKVRAELIRMKELQGRNIFRYMVQTRNTLKETKEVSVESELEQILMPIVTVKMTEGNDKVEVTFAYSNGDIYKKTCKDQNEFETVLAKRWNESLSRQIEHLKDIAQNTYNKQRVAK